MNKEQEEISRMVLDHLRENPDAGDTLEGISEWWLLSERVNQTVDKVSVVLEALVEKDLIRKFKNSNGSFMYKVKKDKLF